MRGRLEIRRIEEKETKEIERGRVKGQEEGEGIWKEKWRERKGGGGMEVDKMC